MSSLYTTLREAIIRTPFPTDLPTCDNVVRPSMRRADSGASQRSAARRQTPTQWSTAAANVPLKRPPSEQSVHVAVLMPLLLHQLSCCSAGHAMNGIEHHWHGTLAGSRTAYPTCNDAAEGSSHGLSMGVTTRPSYALSGLRGGWNACVKCGEVRRGMVMSGCM